MRPGYNLLCACLLAAAMLLGGCGNIKDLELTGIRGFQVNSISTAGIDGNILLGIRNPNRFGFSILPSDFDVRYSGVALGKARLHRRMRIKANSEEVYSFNLKADFHQTNVLDVLKLLNGASFRSELEVKGNLRAGKLFMRRSLPIDIKEKISLK